MKKQFFVGLFIITFIAFCIFTLIVYKNKTQEIKNQSLQSGQNLNAPIEIPDGDIVQYQQAHFKKPAAIMFYVDWCTYCRRFMPIFAEGAKKYSDKFEFVVVNCEHPENEQLVKEYNIGSFPSIFIKDKDLDFEYQVNNYATLNIQNFEKELKKHLKLRSKLQV